MDVYPAIDGSSQTRLERSHGRAAQRPMSHDRTIVDRRQGGDLGRRDEEVGGVYHRRVPECSIDPRPIRLRPHGYKRPGAGQNRGVFRKLIALVAGARADGVRMDAGGFVEQREPGEELRDRAGDACAWRRQRGDVNRNVELVRHRANLLAARLT